MASAASPIAAARQRAGGGGGCGDGGADGRAGGARWPRTTSPPRRTAHTHSYTMYTYTHLRDSETIR